MNRLTNFFLGLIIFLILSPLMVIISILIKLDSKGPIFFISKRVGQDNQNFKMIKFRTMYLNTEIIETAKLENHKSKITKLGNTLRKLSIDEIPQFICVIKGQMAIVGPRPALPSQVELNLKREKLGIHKLKPGITGWAQINGRDEISIDKKVELDYYYLQNKSFLLDLKIIFLTFFKVFKKSNISH